MSGFLRKFFGQQQAPQSTGEDIDLEKFYTDSEYALQIFEQLVTATTLNKRLLVIHGLGGVATTAFCWMRRYQGESMAHRYDLLSRIVWNEGRKVSACL